MSAGFIGSNGVCNWFPEHGEHLISRADLEEFAALRPAGKVFNCVGMEGEWLVVKYGAKTYRVNPEILKPVAAPAFAVGQRAKAGNRLGHVVDVVWHFKESAPIYFLEFDGKRSSRRFAEAELQPV